MASRKVSVPNSTIKAVIFDLNGVMIQNQWPHAEPSMVRLVKDLKKSGIKTGVLSNLWTGSIADVHASDWAQYFDVLGLSGEINSSKPEPASYQAVLDRLGVNPEEALFIDDLPGHIAGARAVGLHTHLFINEFDLRTTLQSLGLLS
jgi:HAD superfamily hydrolase (TIGR01509 family)